MKPRMTDDEAFDAIFLEIYNARGKYKAWPVDPVHAAAVVAEESGELVQASLQAIYEPEKNSPDALKTEAIHTAAMAIRFLTEGDYL